MGIILIILLILAVIAGIQDGISKFKAIQYLANQYDKEKRKNKKRK